MSRAHEEKLELCRQLEAIADALPRPDRLLCLAVASRLAPVLKAAHAYEETIVFPVFERARASAASTDRLKIEHLEDECSAEELTEALLAVGHGAAVPNPEALGFMLRAFFYALRRHVAFEREHILPAVASFSGRPGEGQQHANGGSTSESRIVVLQVGLKPLHM